MKHLLFLLIALFSLNTAFSQLVWVNVSGDTQFCPTENRESPLTVSMIISVALAFLIYHVITVKCESPKQEIG